MPGQNDTDALRKLASLFVAYRHLASLQQCSDAAAPIDESRFTEAYDLGALLSLNYNTSRTPVTPFRDSSAAARVFPALQRLWSVIACASQFIAVLLAVSCVLTVSGEVTFLNRIHSYIYSLVRSVSCKLPQPPPNLSCALVCVTIFRRSRTSIGMRAHHAPLSL